MGTNVKEPASDLPAADGNLVWMTKTLITGANKGLGDRAAQRLLAEGHGVWVAARDQRLARRQPARSAPVSCRST